MKIHFSLSLEAFDARHAKKVRAWRNDELIMRWCRQTDVISDAEQERWFHRQSIDPTIQMYAVMVTVEGRKQLAGVCGFTSIDHFNRRAEFSLYLRPSLHGKGLGRVALQQLLFHGFINRGFNTIYGETFEGNPAVAVFERCGLKWEGRRREFYYKEGRYINALLYAMTRGDWDIRNAPAVPTEETVETHADA